MQYHIVYLAIIIILIIIIVFISAKFVKFANIRKTIRSIILKDPDCRSSLPRKNGTNLRPYDSHSLLLPRTFEQYKTEMDNLIQKAYDLEDFGEKSQLADACKKALNGGKRLRSIILLEVARATSLTCLPTQKSTSISQGQTSTGVDAAEAALFIEYIHSASIIVDDLPSFDNDLIRRGNPSLHADVGPAVAQMAALTLLAAAFQNICRQLDWIRDNCPEIQNVDRIGTRICNDVSRSLGAFGAAGGQYMDISKSETLIAEHGANAVADLMYRKTATFFEISVITGWLVAGGNADQLNIMRDIGCHIGTAFQIADDVSDMKSDALRSTQGKPGWNYANMYGKDKAISEVERNLTSAKKLLKQTNLWTILWEDELFPKIKSMMNL